MDEHLEDGVGFDGEHFAELGPGFDALIDGKQGDFGRTVGVFGRGLAGAFLFDLGTEGAAELYVDEMLVPADHFDAVVETDEVAFGRGDAERAGADAAFQAADVAEGQLKFVIEPLIDHSSIGVRGLRFAGTGPESAALDAFFDGDVSDQFLIIAAAGFPRGEIEVVLGF